MLTGQNGILQRAGEAKVTMDEQEEAEKIQLSYMAEKTNQLGKAVQANGLQEEIEKYGEAEVFDNGNGTFYVLYKDSGNCYFVDKNGNATKRDKTEVVSGVFAIIYSDGTMAFNTTGNTIEGKTVLYKTGDISQTKFETYDDIPWKEHLTKIKTVTFEEEVKPMYTRRWFDRCTNLTQITSIQKLNTKNVKDMHTMFQGCSKFTTLDLSSLDTRNVKSMRSMFNGCKNLISLNVSNFDTGNVTDMSNMFYNCQKLTSLNVSNFDTSNVTDMSSMFVNCLNLTSLNVSNFDTKNVTNMRNMFVGCSKLSSINVSNFDTSNVSDMYAMFAFCTSLQNLNVSSFDTSNVSNMCAMFELCIGLTTLDVSNFDTSNVTDMSFMFGCGRHNYNTKLQEIKGLENFDTSNVTDMSYMFVHQIKLQKLNLSSFDTRNVTNMKNMFKAVNIEKIYVSNKWNTSKVTESIDMFGGKTYVGNDGKTYTYEGVEEPLKLTGGNGTKWDAEHIDKEYARIDTAVYDADGNYVSGDKGYFSVLPGE